MNQTTLTHLGLWREASDAISLPMVSRSLLKAK
jgi:hypothetical protein